MTPEFRVRLRRHPEVHGWYRAVVLPPSWPVPAHLRTSWIELCFGLMTGILPESHQVIQALQFWHLHERGGAEILSRNARRWDPDFGAGVWLDEPPPTLWTVEEFLRTPPGAPMRPPLYQLVRLRPESGGFEETWRLAGGGNLWLAAGVLGDPDSWLASQRLLYEAWVTEPAVLAFDWFLPLLRGRTAESPLLTARLQHLEGLGAYVRESAEDGGLLIWSRQPLDPVFERQGLLPDT